jgi:hypothetical protein
MDGALVLGFGAGALFLVARLRAARATSPSATTRSP